MTSFDYIWEWKKLGASEDLEWPSVCYIQESMYGKRIIKGLSQMATYWFVIGDLSIQRAQKSEVRQAANDVVKSEV